MAIDTEKLKATLAALEDERNRRTAQKLESGELIPIVLGVPRDSEQEANDDPDAPITTIITGVPRKGRDSDEWHPVPNPQDCAYRPYQPPAAPITADTDVKTAPAHPPKPAPVWTKITTTVSPADERSCGVVTTGAFAVDGNQLHVRDHEGRTWTVPFTFGDNPEIQARRILREKFGKHHAFNAPIHYPPRSYH
jgi:hypothetical protein